MNKVFVGVAFISLLIFDVASASQDRLISVNGTCLRRVTPDRARVVITAESREADPKRATIKARESYERVLDRVKKLKLPDAEIQTSEYSVEEVREWENNKQVSRGYRARMGLQIDTSDTRRIGEALEVAAKENIKDVGSLSLFVSPVRDREERNACLKEAAEQARVKAQKLAETLGARLGEVVLINESGAQALPPQPRFKAMMGGAMASDLAEAAPASIEAGKQDLSLSVQVSFNLK